jgi:hypothetical protein
MPFTFPFRKRNKGMLQLQFLLFCRLGIIKFIEASSGSVGRNESLIWQQGRDI